MFQNPFRPLLNNRMLTEYTVLSIEEDYSNAARNAPKSNSLKKLKLVDVTVVRARDFGVNDITFTVKTHLGNILKEGDTVLGYDLTVANWNDDDAASLAVCLVKKEESIVQNKVLPDCVLIRKSYPLFRKSQYTRNWQLKKLSIVCISSHKDDVEQEESENIHKKKGEATKSDMDYEMFLRDIEEDKEMRSQINLYKKGKKESALPQDVEDDAPIVPLEEPVEELTINDEPPAMNNEEEDEEMDMEEDQPIEQDEVTIVRSNRFMS